MNLRRLTILCTGLGSLLSSCVVYMPMQCAAPQITDKKQAEITGSSYLNGRVEVAATYSPVRHLLVRAAYGSLRDNSTDTTYYRGHQYDLGVGTYWQPDQRWLLGALGGFGQAWSDAAYARPGFIFAPTQHVFDARYNKLFGEIYSTWQVTDAISFGVAYRVTQVNFTRLTDLNTPVELKGMTRSEPMLYFRMRPGNGPAEDRPVQLQLAWGSSSTFGYDPKNTTVAYAPGVSELKQGRGYTTVGITVFPHCLFRKAQNVPVDGH